MLHRASSTVRARGYDYDFASRILFVFATPFPDTQLAVVFKHGRRGEYVAKLQVQAGDHVIVQHPDGLDVARVVSVRQGGRLGDKWRVRRIATEEDIAMWRALMKEETKALATMTQYVNQNKIPILLHRAEYQIDKKKITFHFSSDVCLLLCCFDFLLCNPQRFSPVCCHR